MTRRGFLGLLPALPLLAVLRPKPHEHRWVRISVGEEVCACGAYSYMGISRHRTYDWRKKWEFAHGHDWIYWGQPTREAARNVGRTYRGWTARS